MIEAAQALLILIALGLLAVVSLCVLYVIVSLDQWVAGAVDARRLSNRKLVAAVINISAVGVFAYAVTDAIYLVQFAQSSAFVKLIAPHL
ncbi:hypothetical protein [Vibrio phage vB_VhaS-a]|nr:hypothetical protein [Vibrio phage vB_VhaS-a]